MITGKPKIIRKRRQKGKKVGDKNIVTKLCPFLVLVVGQSRTMMTSSEAFKFIFFKLKILISAFLDKKKLVTVK